MWLTTAIFSITYVGLAFGKVPGLRMDRAGIAFVGATAMLVTGSLSFDQAISGESIDYNTLALLFGMMIVIAFLRVSGCFEHFAEFVLKRVQTPKALLATVIVLSGTLSAFLINDIVCLSMTPLVLHLTRRLRVDPIPHLIALAMAANIGSTGTITGNPQNIFIGSHSGIPYSRFALRLLPVAGIGLVLTFIVLAVVYRARLAAPATGSEGHDNQFADDECQIDKANEVTMGHDGQLSGGTQVWLRRKSVAITLAAIVLFFAGLPLELVAMGAAAVLLVGRVRPARIYREVDWSLLVLFTGLFIVVHAFQVRVVTTWNIGQWDWLLSRPVDLLSGVSAVLSNLVSNVPAVLLMEPIVQAVPAGSRETAWLALAMSSTLAGNLTVLGSIANLIVVENAAREGTHISFWEYCKCGIPLTIVTLLVGIGWLEFVHY